MLYRDALLAEDGELTLLSVAEDRRREEAAAISNCCFVC